MKKKPASDSVQPLVSPRLDFEPEEKVPGGFRGWLTQLAAETRHLALCVPGTTSQEVHETRVFIKRLRSLLWFATPCLSLMELEVLKARLRHAAHLLAAQRDLVVTKVMMEKLSRKTTNLADRRALVRLAGVQDIRPAIIRRSDQAMRQVVLILGATIDQLQEAARCSSKWPAASDRVAKAFRAQKRAGKKALGSHQPAQFHDWRKKAKRLFYLLQITEVCPGERMKRTVQRVDALQEKLGEYHDGVIAQAGLENIPAGQLRRRAVRHSVKFLKKRRRRLRKKVRKLFGRIRPK